MITYHKDDRRRDEERSLNDTRREVIKLIQSANEHVKRVKTDLGVEVIRDAEEMHKYARLEDMTYSLTLDKNQDVSNDIQKKGAEYIKDFEHFKPVTKFKDNLSILWENTKTSEIVYAIRGSDAQFFDKERIINKFDAKDVEGMKEELNRVKNIYDWWINAKTVVGKASEDPEYTKLYKKLIRIQEEYGVKPIIVGHSKAGRQATWLGEATNNHKVFRYDAADSPFVNHTIFETEGQIKSYRTPYAIVSTGEPFKNYNHIETITVQPRPGYDSSLVDRHDIKNFYADGGLDTERVTPLRSRLGAMSGVGELVGGVGIGIGLNELTIPKDELENPKSQFYATTDALKYAIPEASPGDAVVDLVFLNQRDRDSFFHEVRHNLGMDNFNDKIMKTPWYKEHPPPHNPDDDSFLTKLLDTHQLDNNFVRKNKYINYETEKYYWSIEAINKYKYTPEQVNKELNDSQYVSRDSFGNIIFNVNTEYSNLKWTNPSTGLSKIGSKTLNQKEMMRRAHNVEEINI